MLGVVMDCQAQELTTYLNLGLLPRAHAGAVRPRLGDRAIRRLPHGGRLDDDRPGPPATSWARRSTTTACAR